MPAWKVLLGILVSLSLSSPRQNANITSVDSYIPQRNDLCTNECSDSEPSYWCGEVREDARGRVMRCAQHTQAGRTCVTECGGKKRYNWCLTNAYSIQRYDWWDYCSLLGHTVNKEPCTDVCGMRGESYWWCHTKRDKSAWDYCSPPGEVKPVQFTVKGSPCKTECRTAGKSYHWCRRSRRYCQSDSCYTDCEPDESGLGYQWCSDHSVGCSTRSDCLEECEEYYCDADWDYCSVDAGHTRYNQPCTGPCARAGKDYYWCNTQGGSWDYCSPQAEIGVHISAKVELTIYGVKCRDVCSPATSDYYWCRVYGRSQLNYWDYCSPHKYVTRYGERCKSACAGQGQSYYWCYTDSSWDYCSPEYREGMLGYESLTAATDTVHRIALIPVYLLWVQTYGA